MATNQPQYSMKTEVNQPTARVTLPSSLVEVDHVDPEDIAKCRASGRSARGTT